ncbi:hypothetical protein [Yersinia intermedia]|uniref:hypothetical protein n=1 Tax=Yersinia intermedia TaxID=631 RepID=UPI0005DF441A|nr:hypothetical protein [Yersinia intermedia]CNE36177.1 Uncharacterised protein [Yersinia intermedia]
MTTLVRWKTLLIRISLSLCVVGLFWFKKDIIKLEALLNASSVIVGLAGTLLGFLITSISLITALMDKRLIANMIKTGHYQRLVSDTILTCMFLLIVIISSLVTILAQGHMILCIFAVTLLFTSLSVFYLIEAGRRFSIIVLNLR